MIVVLSQEAHALITEINRAHREGWVDFTARDALIAFYLEHLGNYPQPPTLAELMEDYRKHYGDVSENG